MKFRLTKTTGTSNKKQGSHRIRTPIHKRKFYVPESPIGPFRSKFEQEIAENLESRNVTFGYETKKINYVLECRYTPDFILPNGVIIEAKGRLSARDARKHRAIKNQHPELDIRFVFMNINTRVEGSRFTHQQWCERYKFEYSERIIPKEWLNGTKKKP